MLRLSFPNNFAGYYKENTKSRETYKWTLTNERCMQYVEDVSTYSKRLLKAFAMNTLVWKVSQILCPLTHKNKNHTCFIW